MKPKPVLEHSQPVGSEDSGAREQADEELFNRIAARYAEKDLAPSSSLARKSQLLAALQPVLTESPNLGTVVDIGCGIGAPARYLAGYYDRYLGIDQSEEIIRHAGRFHQDNPRAEFIAANVKAESLPEGVADVVLSIGALHHMTELDTVMAALRWLAKEGAYLVTIEPQSGNPLIQWMRWLRGLVDADYSREQRYFHRDDLQRLYHENGLASLSIAYQGFLTPPFAQVVMRPDFLSVPLAQGAVKIDSWLQRHLPHYLGRLSWNLVVVGRFVGQRVLT